MSTDLPEECEMCDPSNEIELWRDYGDGPEPSGEYVQCPECKGTGIMAGGMALMAEEIERLRARLDEVTATLLLQVDDTLAKCDEIERLQAEVWKLKADVAYYKGWKDEVEKRLAEREA